jgi:hypothetical protein
MTSIARKKASILRTRAAGPPRKRSEPRIRVLASAPNDANAKAWFAEYRAHLLRQIAAVDDVIADAHPDDKDNLRQLGTNLEGKLAKLAQEEEAAFVTGTLAINSPSQDEIDLTKALSVQMDTVIRSQMRAEAIVQFAGQIANLAQKVGVTP